MPREPPNGMITIIALPLTFSIIISSLVPALLAVRVSDGLPFSTLGIH